MAQYVMMTRVSSEAVPHARDYEKLEREVSARIEKDCPGVRWLSSHAVLGACDYVDIFEAPDNETAAKVAIIVRSLGHANTEVWPAVPWRRFKELVSSELE